MDINPSCSRRDLMAIAERPVRAPATRRVCRREVRSAVMAVRDRSPAAALRAADCPVDFPSAVRKAAPVSKAVLPAGPAREALPQPVTSH